MLSVHPNSVRRWADMGLIRTFRVGVRGDRRFRTEDVDALLEEEQNALANRTRKRQRRRPGFRKR